MTEYTRETNQPRQCHDGIHKAVIDTMDGTKRCALCGFPMDATTAAQDVLAQLARIRLTPPEAGG